MLHAKNDVDFASGVENLVEELSAAGSYGTPRPKV